MARANVQRKRRCLTCYGSILMYSRKCPMSQSGKAPVVTKKVLKAQLFRYCLPLSQHLTLLLNHLLERQRRHQSGLSGLRLSNTKLLFGLHSTPDIHFFTCAACIPIDAVDDFAGTRPDSVKLLKSRSKSAPGVSVLPGLQGI
jgi:hypothetical protein